MKKSKRLTESFKVKRKTEKKLKKVFIFITIFMFLTTGGITALVAAMALFCIYNIFSYGVSLQELSDETL